ncbi:MAG: SRPBCC family protein, partial [Planctomycetota bacterium]
MKLQRSIKINASPDEVWNILGPRFGDADVWASSVNHSAAHTDGDRPAGAPCSGRICQTELGPFRESIIVYDEHRRIVKYEASGEKMPFFVKCLVNQWAVTGSGHAA